MGCGRGSGASGGNDVRQPPFCFRRWRRREDNFCAAGAPHHKVIEGEGSDDRKERDLYDPSKSAWNPELLELVVAALPADEDPATWAAFLHQQPFCFDDYRAALSNH
jgi:hypothetical protein